MRLTALELEQFRKFTGKVRISNFDPGLNLLCAPNEFGKSTLLAAIRGLMFERHNSRAEPVKFMQPWHGNAAPRLAMEFELGGAAWRVEKRFLHQPWARLTGPQGESFEGEAAEEGLQRLLGFGAAGKKGSKPEQLGVWGALWVEQRQSVDQADLSSDLARATISDCLDAEVGVLTGSERGQAVLAAVRQQLGQLIDGNKKPRGRYKEVLTLLDAADKNLADLRARAQRLDDDVSSLRECDAKLARRNNADEAARDERDLQDARRRKEAALQFEQKLAAAAAELRLAGQLFGEADRETQARRARQDNIAGITRDLEKLIHAMAPAEAQAREAEAHLAQCSAAVDLAQVAADEAARAFMRKRAIAAVAQRAATLAALSASLSVAEQAGDRVTKLTARIETNPVTVELISQIRKAQRELDDAQAALEARATLIDIELEAGAAGLLTVNGAACAPGSQTISATQAISFSIANVGHIRVRPMISDRETLTARLAVAQASRANVLRKAGCAAVGEAESLATQRAVMEGDLRAAKQELAQCTQGDKAAKLEPGIDALRARVRMLRAGIEASSADLGLAELPSADEAAHGEREAEAADAQARTHLTQTRAERDAASSAASLARTALDKAAVALGVMRADLERLHAEQRAAVASETDAALGERRAAAGALRVEREAALRALDQTRSADTVEGMNARIARFEQALKNRDNDVRKLREEIAGLRARITQEGGAGLDEMIAAAERKRENLLLEQANFSREASILALLQDTLLEAERETKARYLAPVTNRVTPYLQRLFPGANIQHDDSLQIKTLARDGGAGQAFERLSDGTREQVAVLARLAFAELLIDQGKPAMVILDDALAYSDDERMERMFDILVHAARRMQILVLTCRESLFARLGGHVLEVLQER